TLGFIGLGQMGYPMAANLLRATSKTHNLVAYDTNTSSTTRLSKEGPVSILSNPREVAESADVVFTMLPAGRHVRGVYEQLMEGSRKDQLYVDCSTIDVKTAVEVAGWVHAKGARMVEAPVSGGTGGATNGTLAFMAGARNEKDLEAARPFLMHMGKVINYCGKSGTGQAAKICNNMMLGISMVGACETFNLGRRLGLAPELLNKILNTSSGRSWSTDTYSPVPGLNPNVPASKDYEGGFGVSLMAKDMGLAVAAATESQSPVVLGAAAEQMYKMVATTEGFEGKDFAVVYRWLGGEKELAKK
ncbi:hypothetical protein HKX48_003618, partial [Thoreauomyces humboldtii]